MRKWIVLMTIAAVLSLGVFAFANSATSSNLHSNQPSVSAQTSTSLSTAQDSQESISETVESSESNVESLTDTDNIQSQVDQNGDFQGNY